MIAYERELSAALLEERRRILFIAPRPTANLELQILLRIAGFQLSIQRDYLAAANAYCLLKETEERFGLVLCAVVGPLPRDLQDLMRRQVFENLVLYRRNTGCRRLLCKGDNVILTCHSESLLTYVEALFSGRGAEFRAKLPFPRDGCRICL